MKRQDLKYIIFISVLAPTTAFADCKYIKEGLEFKFGEYKEFRQRNEETLKTLLSTETSCHTKGAEISAKIAKAAEGLSCQAELDASNVGAQMAEIGEHCEAVFKKITELQNKIHLALEQVRFDVDDGLAFMQESRILQENCRREIEDTKKLAREFMTLELSIVAVEGRSIDGFVSYGKFKETAKSLHFLTKARNVGCGELVSQLGGALKPLTGAPAQGAAIAKGKFKNAESTVTGVQESLRARAEGAAIMAGQQPAHSELGVKAFGPKGDASEITGKGATPLIASARDSAGATAGTFVGASAGGARLIVARDPRATGLVRAPAQLSSLGSAIWVESPAAGNAAVIEEVLPIAVHDYPVGEISSASSPVAVAGSSQGAAPSSSPGVVALGEIHIMEELRQQGVKDLSGGTERDLFSRVRRAYHATELFRNSGRRQLAGSSP